MDFAGFTERTFDVGEAQIFARIGGSGPPLVCLHGYPQTHLAWRKVAPPLAARFTVVAPDLRGYGAMARDIVGVMRELGHERFFVAGHDRGGRVAYRMAFDHPARVAALAVLDIMPTLETWEMMAAPNAYSAYHWLFLAQPAPLPERLIEREAAMYFQHTIESWLKNRSMIDDATMRAYLTAMQRHSTIRAACEDYRAGYTCDRRDDLDDRDADRRIAAPLLALWGAGPTARASVDFLEVWRRWADDVSGAPLACGHFLMEEAPDRTASALLDFFASHAI
jgi:haloacetate dehalogenase